MPLSNGPNLGVLVNGAAGDEHFDELMAQFRALDALVQASVIDRDLAAPPGSPTDGDRYIVAASPTGAWTGQVAKIARWSSVVSAWEFYTPKTGWRVFVADEGAHFTFNGTAWEKFEVAPGDLVDAFVYKGTIDCSTNPFYPPADAGDVYKVSVAGTIGTVAGINVEVGDTLYCTVDGSPGGNQATVGSHWTIVQANLDGVIVGPGSSDTDEFMLWNGITGTVAKRASGTGFIRMTSGKMVTRTTAQFRGDLGERVETLTSGTTVAVDAAAANSFRLTLAHNATLENPTNLIDGQMLFFRIKQDGTGSRTLAFGSKYKFPAGAVPTPTTPAGSVDVMSCQYDQDADTLVCVYNKNFS